MGVYKDIPKISFFSVVVFFALYFISFIVIVVFAKSLNYAIYGSLIVALTFALIFFVWSYYVYDGAFFETEDKITKLYIYKLIFIVFYLSYIILSFAVYVIYSKEIGFLLFLGIGLIPLLIKAYGKVRKR